MIASSTPMTTGSVAQARCSAAMATEIVSPMQPSAAHYSASATREPAIGRDDGSGSGPGATGWPA